MAGHDGRLLLAPYAGRGSPSLEPADAPSVLSLLTGGTDQDLRAARKQLTTMDERLDAVSDALEVSAAT